MTTSATISLVDGPSKFDLMTALFVWGPTRPTVRMRSSDGTVYAATITSCEAEDGSGECWNIKGVARRHATKIAFHEKFTGFFRTDTRKGFIRFMT
jgi:predicted nucleic acid-binding Zn ribbon protein